MKTQKLILVLALIILGPETFPQSSQVLKYLYSISGKKTIAGQHNKEPNAKPAMWTEYIKKRLENIQDYGVVIFCSSKSTSTIAGP